MKPVTHRNSRALLALLALLAMAAAGASPAGAQESPRAESVAIDADTGVATVEGSVTGYETRDYEVPALAGQVLSVVLESDSTANTFNILPPDAEHEAVFIGSTSGNRFIGELDLDGQWRIRVYQVRAAARRGETASYRLAIKLTGEPDPGKARAANDFGPREWDARGKLGCATGGQPMQTANCAFKVIRYQYEEGATVFIEAPVDHEVRILYFLNGEWSTDTGARIDVRRRADLWSLVVDDEAYEIPDAVLFGG